MTKQEFTVLNPGIYKIYWKLGITSYGALGMNRDGDRWLAPINCTKPLTDASRFWRLIDRLELIQLEE